MKYISLYEGDFFASKYSFSQIKLENKIVLTYPIQSIVRSNLSQQTYLSCADASYTNLEQICPINTPSTLSYNYDDYPIPYKTLDHFYCPPSSYQSQNQFYANNNYTNSNKLLDQPIPSPIPQCSVNETLQYEDESEEYDESEESDDQVEEQPSQYFLDNNYTNVNQPILPLTISWTGTSQLKNDGLSVLSDNILLSINWDNIIRFWYLTTGVRQELSIEVGHNTLWQFFQTPDGYKIITFGNNIIRLQDVNGAILKTLNADCRTEIPLKGCILLNDRRIVYASDTRTLICEAIFPENNAIFERMSFPAPYRVEITCFKALRDRRIIVGIKTGRIFLWNLNLFSYTPLPQAETYKNHAIDQFLELADGRLLSFSSQNGMIKIWNLNLLQLLATIANVKDARCFVELNDGIIAFSLPNQRIAIWEVPNLNNTITLTSKTVIVEESKITKIIKLDENRFVSALENGTINIWNTNTYEKITTFHGHTRAVTSLIKLNENRLISGSDDNTIKIWSV